MSKRPPEKLAPDTRLVTAGRPRGEAARVVNEPVWRASTHLYPDCAALRGGARGPNEDGRFFYGRRGAPTQWALAEALTALEPGAEGTVLYPSGLAAIAGALLAVLEPGDVVLVADNAYDPTRATAAGLLARMGVGHRFFDPRDPEAYAAAFCERTRAVMLENPGSLTMELCDVPALCAEAHARGVCVLIDNTWATSLGFPALERGADIAITALTKHVGGHSDLMMGAATATAAWYPRLRLGAQQLGHVVSPDDAALALRGLRTLGVRLERQTRTALAVAQWLEGRAEVARVLCPMLPGAPDYDIWRCDFTGACGLFSFILKGGNDAARCRFIDALSLFGIGYSWGGFESLALPFDVAPVRSVMAWPPTDCDPADRHAVRLAIGLEDAGDLMADLERGFAALAGETE